MNYQRSRSTPLKYQEPAIVDASGSVTPFGPMYAVDSALTGLAVSPDGARVAIAPFPAMPSTAASIVVMPMPGRAGATQSWPVADPDANETMSLSWSPDGRRLTYIAGSQTGGGIGSNPITLDTAKAGKLPTHPAWASGVGCEPTGMSWFGTSGRFAIVRD